MKQSNGMVRLAAALLLALSFGGCAETAEGGTNTNWISCKKTSDCPETDACVERRCVPRSDARDGSGGATATGGSATTSGGAGGSGGASGEGTGGVGIGPGLGSNGDETTCTPVEGWDEYPDGSAISWRRAPCNGCHPTQNAPVGQDAAAFPCRNEPAIHQPRDLPCGACTDDQRTCSMTIQAYCDFDGSGPDTPVLSSFETDGVGYSDQWLCACTGGQWHCWLRNPSGAACQFAG